MNIMNMQVHHRQFGDGIITGQTVTTAKVRFSEEHGEKTFLYPSAFESFLVLADPSVKEQMDSELQRIRDLAEAERRTREEEEERRREEEKRALLEEKRAATKKRASAKKAAPKAKKQPAKQSEDNEDIENSDDIHTDF